MAGVDTLEKTGISSTIQNEDVYYLDCTCCLSPVCTRAMKAFLVADAEPKMELYSTDQLESSAAATTDEKFHTDTCKCVLQNMVCMKCGNILGYHVTMPCRTCLQAQNNGHYWVFFRSSILPYPRLNLEGTDTMLWGDLANCDNKICDTLWEECER